MTADDLHKQPDDTGEDADIPEEAPIPAGPEAEPVSGPQASVEDDPLATDGPLSDDDLQSVDDLQPADDLLPADELPSALEPAASPEPEALTVPGAELESREAAAPPLYPPASQIPPATWPQTGIPALPVGALMIALGVILLWPLLSGGFALAPAVVAAILIAGIAFSLFMYWLRSGRRARGAFFLALWGIITAVLTGLFAQAPQTLDAYSGWPLYLIGTGAALFVTYLINRAGGHHLPVLSFTLIAGGLVALAVTRQAVPADVLDFARQEWRWLGVILILGLLPLAFRRRVIPG